MSMRSATPDRPQVLLAAVCLLGLVSTAGVSMPYPVLTPIFVSGPADNFTHFAGAPPEALLGVALAANPLGLLIGSLVIGPGSDRVGRRRMLLWTLCASALGFLATAVALHERAYVAFVLARFATGLAEGNMSVARALLADLHPRLDRTRSFAWLNACLYSGWLIGPLIGGLSLPLGEPVPFVMAAGALLPGLALLLWVLPATAPAATHTRGELSALALLRQDPLLARLFAVQLAYTAGLTALYDYAPLWMVAHAGLDSRGIALVTAAQCATMTAGSLAIGSRWGVAHGAAGGAPLPRAAQMAAWVAAGLAALVALPGPAGLAVIIALGLPIAVHGALVPSWASERFSAHGQGRIMGLLSTTFCLANVAVALAGGLAALASVRWVMGLGAVACGLAAIALWRWPGSAAAALPASSS